MASEYGSSDIQVLEGLDAVRMRPGMYIGSTGSRGLHHLLWEIVDNGIDEVANGFGDLVTVTLHKDGSVTVTDNGRGIPVDIHPKLGVSGVQVVFTQLHAGGKFDAHNYNYSGGLHGVGASVVNALSEWLTCEVYKDGYIYRQEFASVYNEKTGKVSSGVPKGPLQKVGNTRKRGSVITYKPDPRVFESTHYSFETISRRLRDLAFLNNNLCIRLTDEREREDGAYKRREYHFKGGLSDFVTYLNQDRTPLYQPPIFLTGKRDNIYVEAAIQYTDAYSDNLFSYVNNIPTTEGGTHETGFKAAITRVFNEFARKNGILKEKDNNLTGDDFREGMTAVLSVKMQNIQFEGQTKTKLGNTEARPAVEGVIAEQLTLYLEDIRNQAAASTVLEKAVQAARVREAARKAKDIARKKNSLEGAPLVGKLASCIGKDPTVNELFIVEGDSAGGSAKQGRDRRFQAILPLRGKPLNAEKKRLDEVLANDECRTIITALGTGIDEDFDISALKYDKVIILSDADQDGAHIRAILLTFFFRYMRELISQGHVYIGMPPLYKVARGKTTIYAYSDKELNAAIRKVGKGYTLQRYKGLGEMNPEQLWDTTLNPEQRTMVRVTIDDAAEADWLVTTLMGEKVEKRKIYISEHADFNKVDTFAQREAR
ncbi:type IIA DNA topoisomerase subunit B [Christensenellaceae bacterium NSJ-44]|uniref:DNA topoisomerase (ATP-hydrolyzing) n=1 Tax=Luoshenia tenuis TaxID=2763654 RepID=A0A926CZG7_9FIRM|nr:DNA topoisomerase subunit B [Luoshenia tenuis]MBC8528953.1 type IIA DNA topoisomerase subunit B [Luoshenia tenuis]